ncbi:MAG TPA: hypothetical protein VGO80_08565 [Solirubrobacteraceae bacterium]|nr:hypothetical protein [Solirubrobacteraceae bacterium]
MSQPPVDWEHDGEIVVLDEPRVVEPQRAPLSPVLVQTAAAMGVSMVAGATAVALVHRRRTRRMARRRRRVLAPVVASRSFLIDVHVLGERGK